MGEWDVAASYALSLSRLQGIRLRHQTQIGKAKRAFPYSGGISGGVIRMRMCVSRMWEKKKKGVNRGALRAGAASIA